MTKEKFRDVIISRNKISNRISKILATILILIGLVFIFLIIRNGLRVNTDSQIKKTISQILIITSPMISIFGGFLMLRRIPKQYEITEILDNQEIDTKLKIFKDSLNNYRINETEKLNEIIKFQCTNKLSSAFIIYLYIDNNKYLYNVISGYNENQLGVYDFGLSYRISKKIKASLQQLLKPNGADV